MIFWNPTQWQMWLPDQYSWDGSNTPMEGMGMGMEGIQLDDWDPWPGVIVDWKSGVQLQNAEPMPGETIEKVDTGDEDGTSSHWMMKILW